MLRILRVAALGIAVATLCALNWRTAQVAYAHNWWHWHWHTGSTIDVWVGGSKVTEHKQALSDWDGKTDVNFTYNVNHTELSVFDGNYGATGWWGLASIESYDYDWWHYWDWSKITHCHSRFNTYYGGTSADVRGVQCQEVGHCLGLDHSNTGDCMGKGYYNAINVVGSHNVSDIAPKY